MSEVEFRVWWIPQIPGGPFLADVPDLATGVLLCDVLAKYDLFQFEQNIKPDYANVGGMSYRHPVLTDGEWQDFDPDDEYEMGELRVDLARYDEE